MQQQKLELEQAILRDDTSAIEALAVQPDFKLYLDQPVSANDFMLPLAYACYLGHPSAVRCLVAHGADPCKKDGYGWTAMAWLLDITTCKLSEQERCELFELLLSVGGQSEINLADSRDMTLCDWCTIYKQNIILNYLREKGGLTNAELDSQPYLEIIG